MPEDKIAHCTDEDLDMAIDYLYRYENGTAGEDNAEGVHRVAAMLKRMMEARWRRNARMRAKAELRRIVRKRIKLQLEPSQR